MDIASIVNHEQLFELDIKHPTTDAPLGIKVWLRSSSSDEVKEVTRAQTNKSIAQNRRGKTAKSEQLEADLLERVAACVAKWEWGTHPKTGEQNTFEGEVPDCTPVMVKKVLSKLGWFFAQCSIEADRIENFTQS